MSEDLHSSIELGTPAKSQEARVRAAFQQCAGRGNRAPSPFASKAYKSKISKPKLQVVGAHPLLKRAKIEGKWEGKTMLQLVRTALSGCHSSPYLTVHEYFFHVLCQTLEI